MTDQSTIAGNLSALIQIQTSKPARELSTLRQSTPATDDIQSRENQKTIEAAEKFEALLIHNMLKGMRKTTMSENTSNGRAIYDDMLDEKLADTMIEAGGLGVAKQIISQIQASTHANAQAITSDSAQAPFTTNPDIDAQNVSIVNSPGSVTDSSSSSNIDHSRLRELARSISGNELSSLHELPNNTLRNSGHSRSTSKLESGLNTTDVMRLRMASELWGKEENYDGLVQKREFLEPLIPHAKRSAKRLGTSHEAILAIAALETGWGKLMIKTDQGQNSHNLFGIKATARDKVIARNTTTEFIDGRAEKIEANFRTYKSSAEAVDGFATFVLENPRYSNALKHASEPERFLQELQSAGYATDPNYANKAISVMRQIKSYPLPL